jgi:hypothetical protein
MLEEVALTVAADGLASSAAASSKLRGCPTRATMSFFRSSAVRLGNTLKRSISCAIADH